jgi:hypothetical protein
LFLKSSTDNCIKVNSGCKVSSPSATYCFKDKQKM